MTSNYFTDKKHLMLVKQKQTHGKRKLTYPFQFQKSKQGTPPFSLSRKEIRTGYTEEAICVCHNDPPHLDKELCSSIDLWFLYQLVTLEINIRYL